MKVYVVSFTCFDIIVDERFDFKVIPCVTSSLEIAKEMAQAIISGEIHWMWWETEPDHHEASHKDTLYYKGKEAYYVAINEYTINEYDPSCPIPDVKILDLL